MNPSPRRRALAATLFVIGSVLAMLCAGVGTAVLLAVVAIKNNVPIDTIAVQMPPGVLGVAMLIQFFAMSVVAALVAWWVGRGSVAFALNLPPAASWPLALIGGLMVGVFPGWLASWLTQHLPSLDLGGLGKIGDMIQRATAVEMVLVVAGICVAAPLVEELCFRGLMFDLLGAERSPVPALIGSSLLFAAYHFDPVHALAVLFTGFFLGWLRLRTGSVWPGVLAHAVNNTSATVTLLLVGGDMEATQLGFFASAAFGLATVGVGLLALLLPRPRTPEPAL